MLHDLSFFKFLNEISMSQYSVNFTFNYCWYYWYFTNNAPVGDVSLKWEK